MAKYSTLTALFGAIANSLRAKTGTSGKIIADDFPSVIDGISVGVEGGIIPTGTRSITSNGTYDVRSYENAEVNVPIPSGYIKPSGTKSIATNGTHDVTNFASANVNVPVPEQITEVRTITFSSNITGSGQNHSILTADEFVKKYYANDNLAITLCPITTFDATANDFLFIYHANKNIASNGATRTGFILKASSATTTTVGNCTAKINGKGYNMHFRADSSGNLTLHTAANYNIKAGQYMLVMTCP